MFSSEGMVVLNIFISLILGLSFFLYKYIYPKKEVNSLIFLILISLLPLVSILRPGTYESGDLSINAIKTMAFYQNLTEGNFIPRWAGELNATFGYPLFVFTYPLPYYIASFFHFLGFSFITSVKLLLIFSYVLSGIFMYKFLKDEFSEFPALVGSVFYLFAPYHLIDMHFRVAIGEMLAFMFIPLILLFTIKLIHKQKFTSFAFLSFLTALLILSHQAVSLVFIPFLLLFAIFYLRFKKKKASGFLLVTASLAMGLLLSSFYLIPLLYYSPLTHQASLAEVAFTDFKLLLFSPWKLSFLYQGPMGELSFPIGFPQILISILTAFLILKKGVGKYKNILVALLVLTFILIFLMTPWSKVLWEITPLVKNFQFSYRLSVVTSLLIALIAAIVATKIDRKIMLFLTFLAIFLTILNWGNRRNIPQIDDDYLRKELSESSVRGEGLYPAMPIWTNPINPFISKVPDNHLVIPRGKGRTLEISRNTTQHVYDVNLFQKTEVKENTLYFPGWKVFSDGQEVVITERNPITFHLEKGKHQLKVIFEETKVMRISLFISLTSLFILLVFLSRGLSKLMLRFPKIYP